MVRARYRWSERNSHKGHKKHKPQLAPIFTDEEAGRGIKPHYNPSCPGALVVNLSLCVNLRNLWFGSSGVRFRTDDTEVVPPTLLRIALVQAKIIINILAVFSYY